MKLKKYMNMKNISIEKAASDLGISYENVRRYTADLVIPRPAMMKKIVEWSGGEVTANDFYLTENGEK